MKSSILFRCYKKSSSLKRVKRSNDGEGPTKGELVVYEQWYVRSAGAERMLGVGFHTLSNSVCTSGIRCLKIQGFRSVRTC